MAYAALGILTSDPNLLGCELDRLRDRVGLGAPDDGWRAGRGSYAQDEVLLRVYPSRSTPREPSELAPTQESPVVLFHAESDSGTGSSDSEESGQPMRFGTWLFVVGGALPAELRWRDAMAAELPPYLRQQVASWSPPHTVFADFLRRLRDLGRTEDTRLPAPLAGELLGATARHFSEATAQLTSAADAVLLATNGHLLLAARVGKAQLSFSLLEGSGECERHALTATAARETDPAVREHRKCRSVVVASHPKPERGGSGWRALAPGEVLCADARLSLEILPQV